MRIDLPIVAHPVRIATLHELHKSVASPVELVASRRVRDSLRNVAYHVRVLRDSGLLEVAGTEQRRGAINTSYRLTAHGRRVHAWLIQVSGPQ